MSRKNLKLRSRTYYDDILYPIDVYLALRSIDGPSMSNQVASLPSCRHSPHFLAWYMTAIIQQGKVEASPCCKSRLVLAQLGADVFPHELLSVHSPQLIGHCVHGVAAVKGAMENIVDNIAATWEITYDHCYIDYY